MPYIKQIPVNEATGLLKKNFEQELESTGHVWNIMHIMSIAPRTAPLSTADHALCSYAEKLTLHQDESGKAEIDKLRAQGFDD